MEDTPQCWEIERLDRQLTEIEAVDNKSVVNYLLRVFFPGLLLLLFLIGLGEDQTHNSGILRKQAIFWFRI